MQKNSQIPFLVEAITRNKSGKILLLKRSGINNFYKDMWQLPGGKVDKGENVTNAIKRELKEETNCNNNNLVFEKVFLFNQKFNEFKGKHLLMVFSCKLVGKLKLSEDHVEYNYFSLDEIKSLKLAPISKKALFE